MEARRLAHLVGPAERALALLQRAGLEGEVRAEAFVDRALSVHEQALAVATTTEGAGLGVRVLRGARSGYAATTDPTPAELRRVVAEAARLAGARRTVRAPGPAVRRRAAEAEDPDLDRRLDLMRRATRAGRDAGKEVSAAVAILLEREGERLVLRTDGSQALWAPRAVALEASVVSRALGGLAKGREFHGGSLDLDAFEGTWSPEAMGKRAAEWAAERIAARRPPAGRHRVLADPLLAGVLAHESFGHLAEGDLVASGWSVLKGREGARLGSRHATIRDTGVPPEGAGGLALPFDDEGTPSREVTVLERGVLRGFLHGRATAGAATTGNARALDFRHPPICRLRNTYFAPGDLAMEEALEALGDGILACGSTGGEARNDGTFLFSAERAYRVRRGEVREPLRDVALVGNVLSTLRAVEGATRGLRILAGPNVNCGKWGQWPLPVGYGGPHVLLGPTLVGGEGTSWGGPA